MAAASSETGFGSQLPCYDLEAIVSGSPLTSTSVAVCFFLFCFLFFWLHWVFVAACGLSLFVASRGLLFIAGRGLLIAVASLVVECGL